MTKDNSNENVNQLIKSLQNKQTLYDAALYYSLLKKANKLSEENKELTDDEVMEISFDYSEQFANAFIEKIENDTEKYSSVKMSDILKLETLLVPNSNNDVYILDEQSILKELIEQIEKELESLVAGSDKKEIPKFASTHRDNYEHPVDKVDNVIWKLLETETQTKQIDGQISITQIPIAVENAADKKKGIERNIMYSINFNSLANNAVIKRLTPFDKRVYFAIANLYDAGNEYLSINMIYSEMGNAGTCPKSSKEKIVKSIKKLMGAVITLNNLEELAKEYYDNKGHRQNVGAYNYDKFEYSGNLLYAEFGEAIINGQTVNSLHVLKVPILYSFAKARKQITTFKKEVLQIPLSQTDTNLLLEDYLIEEIQRIKNKNRNNKMLFDTIFENCNIKTNKQKTRAKEKIKVILEFFASKESKHFIKSYEMTNDSFVINY